MASGERALVESCQRLIQPKTMNYSFQVNLESGKHSWWLSNLGHKDTRKKITVGAGFLSMYAGFTLLLLPMMISVWPLSLTLADEPQVFGFEDDLGSVSSVYGTPMAVASPVASGRKAVECQNGDYVRWDLAMLLICFSDDKYTKHIAQYRLKCRGCHPICGRNVYGATNQLSVDDSAMLFWRKLILHRSIAKLSKS